MGATSSELNLAASYFERFERAFATFDGHRVSELFMAPGVALQRDGTTIALTTREDVQRYYQAALDHYHRDGCRSCRWSQLEVTPTGRQSMLAAVTWELLRGDGSVAVQWRQSYSLGAFDDAGPRAFASAMHVV